MLTQEQIEKIEAAVCRGASVADIAAASGATESEIIELAKRRAGGIFGQIESIANQQKREQIAVVVLQILVGHSACGKDNMLSGDDDQADAELGPRAVRITDAFLAALSKK